MKTLLLLRHAKSSWDDSSLRDYDRPLAARGRRDAPRMGHALAERGPLPQLVVTSPAVRAQQTTEAFTKAARYEGPVKVDDHIYAASSAELMSVVRGLPEEHSIIMLVGHNPGFEDFVARLTTRSQAMATCALACISLPIDEWRQTENGGGTLEWTLKPKEL